MTSLFSLIERLERASGPSRELDAQVMLYLHPGFSIDYAGWVIKPDGKRGMGIDNWSRTFTASIDKTREMMPYLCVSASDIGADGLSQVIIVADTSTSPVAEFTGIHSRLEIAWLIASLKAHDALRALVANEGGGNG